MTTYTMEIKVMNDRTKTVKTSKTIDDVKCWNNGKLSKSMDVTIKKMIPMEEFIREIPSES